MCIAVDSNYSKTAFKSPAYTRMLRCKPTQNAHILACMPRFFVGLRLAYGHKPGF